MSSAPVAERPLNRPSLPHSIEAVSPIQPVPAWWRQSHSWVFAVSVALNALFAWIVVRGLLLSETWMDPGPSACAQMAMMGLFMGQLYLAALWLAFGGLSTPLRFALVTLAVVVGALAGTLGASFRTDPSEVNLILLIAACVALLVVTIAQVLLAPARWLTGWRIDFDAAYHPKEEGRRLQLRLWHYLSLTFLVTLPLVLYRSLTALLPHDEAPQVLFAVGLIAAIALTVSLPLTWLILTRNRFLAAALALVAGVGLAAAIGAWSILATDWGPMTIWLVLGTSVVLPAAVVLSVGSNLLLLRLWGLNVICLKVA